MAMKGFDPVGRRSGCGLGTEPAQRWRRRAIYLCVTLGIGSLIGAALLGGAGGSGAAWFPPPCVHTMSQVTPRRVLSALRLQATWRWPPGWRTTRISLTLTY